MSFRSWQSLIETSTGDFTEYSSELARQATRGVCRLWRAHPNNIFALSPVNRGVMRSVCNNFGEPPPRDDADYPSGVYAISLRFIFVPRTAGGAEGERNIPVRNCETRPWVGSIDSLNLEIDPPVGTSLGQWRVKLFGQQAGDPVPQEYQVLNNEFSRFADIDPASVVFTVTDCDPTPDMLPDELTETINVTTINNTTGDTISNDTYTVTAPVTENNIDLGTTIDVGGVQINLDVGGITFGGGDGSAPSGLPRGGSGSGGTGGDGDSIVVPRTVIDNSNYRTIFVNPNTGEEVGSEEEQEEIELAEEELPPEIIFLGVTISTKPTGARTQIYRDSDDTDYFAGYLVFNVVRDGLLYQEPALSIRKEHNLFRVPTYATGYRLYAINGARLKIKQISLEIE